MNGGTLSACRRLFRYGIVALVLAGTLKLGTGLWIPVKAALAQELLEVAWSDTRAGQAEARPWPWADTRPMARLWVPRLGLDWIVLSGASGRNLAFAPSHMDGSAALGERGVSVIAGHRDTHFAVLEKLELGDRIEVEQPDGSLLGYRIAAIEIVDTERARLRLDADRPMLVLVTCYPFDAVTSGSPLRYVVTAEREMLQPT